MTPGHKSNLQNNAKAYLADLEAFEGCGEAPESMADTSEAFDNAVAEIAIPNDSDEEAILYQLAGLALDEGGKSHQIKAFLALLDGVQC